MRLIALEGVRAGAELPLGPAPLVFGRGPACDVQLDDPDVSREHCRVSRTGGGHSIEDLGSRNGTILNGQRIGAPAPLRPGDLIVIGQSVFEVRPEPVSIGLPRLPAPAVQSAGPEPFRPPARAPVQAAAAPVVPAKPAATLSHSARRAAHAGEQLLARLEAVAGHLATIAPSSAGLVSLRQGHREAEAAARRLLAACERAAAIPSPYQRADLLVDESAALHRALAAALEILRAAGGR